MQSVDGRRKRSVSCSQCCNKDREDYLPCNGFLCGKSKYSKTTPIVRNTDKEKMTKCTNNSSLKRYIIVHSIYIHQ